MRVVETCVLLTCVLSFSCSESESTRDLDAGASSESDAARELAMPSRSENPAKAAAGAAAPNPSPQSSPKPAAAGAAAPKPSQQSSPKPAAAGAAAPKPSQQAGAPASAPASTDAGMPAADSGSAQSTYEIETVALNVVYITDLSGNPVGDARPIILFKDGWACKDMNFVVRGLDVAEHKAMYPDSWAEWQRVDNKLALKNSKGKLQTLDYQITYPPNPAGFTLEDKYTRSSSGVNNTLGTTAFSRKDIHLWHNGRVAIGSYTVLTAPPDRVSQDVPPDSRGTYRIDGYVMQITWDDGTLEKTSFVYNDRDSKAIYVDGVMYIIRN